VAVLSTVVATVGPVRVVAGRVLPHLTAYHVAFLVAAGLALLAALAALSVRDADAASTIVPRRRQAGSPAGPAGAGAAGAGAPSGSPEPMPAGG
jgi:hypothetical protein